MFITLYCGETESAVRNSVKLIQWSWRSICMLFNLVYKPFCFSFTPCNSAEVFISEHKDKKIIRFQSSA